LFVRPNEYNEKSLKKISSTLTIKILEELCAEINEIEPFKESSLSESVKGWINKNEYNF